VRPARLRGQERQAQVDEQRHLSFALLFQEIYEIIYLCIVNISSYNND